ncbi:hypothetical protein QCA50_005938 [Cerrena zonata]|uniref:Uncharacterized protein n=1 Tax=Cerrena zonata TaxID=2478898 RepID=A0AAW0GLN0_9APHY
MNAAMVNLPVVTFFISIDMLCGGPSSLTLRNPRGSERPSADSNDFLPRDVDFIETGPVA